MRLQASCDVKNAREPKMDIFQCGNRHISPSAAWRCIAKCFQRFGRTLGASRGNSSVSLHK